MSKVGIDIWREVEFPDQYANEVWYSQKSRLIVAEQTFDWSAVVHVYKHTDDGYKPLWVGATVEFESDSPDSVKSLFNMININRIREN